MTTPVLPAPSSSPAATNDRDDTAAAAAAAAATAGTSSRPPSERWAAAPTASGARPPTRVRAVKQPRAARLAGTAAAGRGGGPDPALRDEELRREQRDRNAIGRRLQRGPRAAPLQ